jgi:exodeoxyribonuclease VII large subunit
MVADAECRTPTEAGARVVPRKADLLVQLEERRRRLDRETRRRVLTETERLAERQRRLAQSLPALLQRRRDRLERLRGELARLSPSRQLDRRRDHLDSLGRRLTAAGQRALRDRTAALEGRRVPARLRRVVDERLRGAALGLAQRRRRLEALSPELVLARGYSITLDEEGRLLRSASETAPDRGIQVRLAKGTLSARVEEVRP